MAIVTYNGQGYSNPITAQAPDRMFAEGQVKSIYSKATIANGDSATSVFYMGRVPSDARILPQSSLVTTANAGLTSFSIGLSKPALDVQNPPASASAAQLANVLSTNCLMSAVNIAAATSFPIAPAAGSGQKRAWELAGLTADPGGYLDVVGLVNNASGAASTAEAHLLFAHGAP